MAALLRAFQAKGLGRELYQECSRPGLTVVWPIHDPGHAAPEPFSLPLTPRGKIGFHSKSLFYRTNAMLDYFALGLLFFVGITLFYGIIAIHDIPYEIARRREHPHQDAIHVAGWISLFTLHVLWPFLWIWATLYRKDRGWGFTQAAHDAQSGLEQRVEELARRLEELEGKGGNG